MFYTSGYHSIKIDIIDGMDFYEISNEELKIRVRQVILSSGRKNNVKNISKHIELFCLMFREAWKCYEDVLLCLVKHGTIVKTFISHTYCLNL